MASCSACHRSGATPSHAAQQAASAPAPPRTAAHSTAIPQTDPDTPVISASIEAGDGDNAYAGWPMIVVARISAPRARTSGLAIAAPAGGWTAAVRIDALESSGRAVAWPFHLATTASGTLALDAADVGYAGWWLSPDETAHLATGDFKLTIRLDTRGSSQGWKGTAASQTIVLHLKPPPPQVSGALQALHARRVADWHMLQGDNRAAAGDIDALLAQQPNDVPALTLKGDLLMNAGHAPDAITAYDRAIALAVAQQPKDAEPPRILLSKRRAAKRAAGVE
jgi:hypothetical protein